MQELIKVEINERQEPFVSGRQLHEFLEVKTQYKDWFPRMVEYGFTDGTDFCSILSESTGGRPAQDHAIKIDMAKELCMIQRTERGKQARKYFIEVEKEFNSPERIMARALIIAEKQIESLKLDNKVKEQQIAELQPKATYYDLILQTPTQRAMEMGLFEIKETTISNPDGSIRVTKTPKVTGKGQQYFINMFVGKVKAE